MRVDVHAHCFPKAYIEELKKTVVADDVGSRVELPEWSGSEETIEAMDKVGVDIQVLSLSTPNVYFSDAGRSMAMAQMTNDFISDVCKTYPDRFLGLASVPLNNLKYAIDELDRAINHLDMDGVLLGTNINQKPLSEPEFIPFFEHLDEIGIPIIIHPMRLIGSEAMSEEDRELGIPSRVGFIYETTRTMVQMTFKGVFERFKNLTFILAHSGGAIPFVHPRWDIGYLAVPDSHPLRKLPNLPSYYLKRHYYDTALSYYHTSLRSTVDFAGVDHVLFGTDSPIISTYLRSKDTIEKINTYGFAKEEKEKIFFRNAANLFPKLKWRSFRTEAP